MLGGGWRLLGGWLRESRIFDDRVFGSGSFGRRLRSVSVSLERLVWVWEKDSGKAARIHSTHDILVLFRVVRFGDTTVLTLEDGCSNDRQKHRYGLSTPPLLNYLHTLPSITSPT